MFIQAETEPSVVFTAPSLRVYLLGSLNIEWAGHPLAIPRRQTRALFYRLAATSQPILREQLCFLFWPDTSEYDAHRNFSRLLTHLRRALPRPEILLVFNDQIWLDSQQVWSDAVVFEQLCATSESHQQAETLQQAVDLYRGPFLAGFSLADNPEFETWVTLERQTCERLYLEALTTLIEKQTARGAYHTAITYAQRYLATDDLAEDIHRRLIELYAASGDRNAALRQFEHCTVILERELGVSPLPETRAAYQAVLKDRILAQLPPAAPPTWTTLPSLDAPLVGRDEALYCLEQAYQCARSGQGRLVLISGEPGIGKSRLMQDFLTELPDEPTLVVGGGHEDERDLPYWLLVQAVGPHLLAIDPALPDFEPLYLAELAGLWPKLRRLLPKQPTAVPLGPSQECSLLFQALAHLLLNLAAQCSPLVLCLDDLHWADEATLAWLGYLARQLTHTRILILGAYRSEEVAVVTPLRTELARLGSLQEIKLAGLSQLEVLHLVRHLSGQTDGAELFSRRLHRETAGNPFFLLEILRAMFEAGLLWEDETGWSTEVDETTQDYRELPLPDSVHEAIRVRLSRLNSLTRQVLEAGAVLGRQFNFDLVQAISGRHEREVIEALEILLARQIIAEHEGKYRFNHHLIRAVIYQISATGVGGCCTGEQRKLWRKCNRAMRLL